MNKKLNDLFKVERHQRLEFFVKLIIVIIGVIVIINSFPQLIDDLQSIF